MKVKFLLPFWHMLTVYVLLFSITPFPTNSLSLKAPFPRAVVDVLHDVNVHKHYPVTSASSSSWAFENNLAHEHAQTHSIFSDLASYLRFSTDEFGSRASCAPYVIRCGSGDTQLVTFGVDELQKALKCDFLDAGEGSTEMNKGWRMQPVGNTRRGTSFQGSRLLFQDLTNAKGTCIFNSAGAYISSTLAATSLAALDGMDGVVPGVCLNMYVTRGDAKVSAPPHTDKQDVMVVQTQGRKHWRIFSPPDTGVKSKADPFARGKGVDDLSLETLSASGSKLLLEVTLFPGDLLFVPARFPHTTDTLSCYRDEPNKIFGLDDWSMHLTIGLDSHVWSMNYLSMRKLGLRKFGIQDCLSDSNTFVNNEGHDDDDAQEGVDERINNLSVELREVLFSSVDSSLTVEAIAMDLYSITERTNNECGTSMSRSRYNNNYNKKILSLEQCVLIVTMFLDIGQGILNTHRDMYVAAIEEETARQNSDLIWTAQEENMSTEQMQRLSIFRVARFFMRLDGLRDELRTWDKPHRLGSWAASQTILNGDQVEISTPGPDGVYLWSPAKVVNARMDGLFDIQRFDGNIEYGVPRNMTKGPHGIGIFL